MNEYYEGIKDTIKFKNDSFKKKKLKNDLSDI